MQIELPQKHKLGEQMRIQDPTSPHVASALGGHEKPPTKYYSDHHFSFPLLNNLKIAKICFINGKKNKTKPELSSPLLSTLLRVELSAPSVFCLAAAAFPPPLCHQPIKINCSKTLLHSYCLAQVLCLFSLFFLFVFCSLLAT